MEIIEIIGLVIFASLFAFNGYKHIRYHSALSGYARPAFGDCPVGDQLAYIGGWPTGVFLLVFAIGTVFIEHSVFPFGLAAFLATTGLLFHRNLSDPANFKHWALFGAALYIAANVS